MTGEKKMASASGFLIIGLTLAVVVYISKQNWIKPPVLPQELTPTVTPVPSLPVCQDDLRICPDGTQVGRHGENCDFFPCPTTFPSSEPGWTTYKNYELGFEISFPNQYRVVRDEDGWPSAVALIYKGGQSYDLAIEIWDSAAEYEEKYKTDKERLIVVKIGEKYLTIFNITREKDAPQIIASFKTIN